MAKVKLNPAFEQIHGKVGDLVFKTFNGREIVGRMPDRTGITPTENQLAQMDRFRLATVYGKAALADADSRAIYENASASRGVPVFAMSVGDFLTPPVVDEIDLSAYTGKANETIRVRASDDVEVEGVALAIRAQDGTVIEQGACTLAAGSARWTYTTKTALTQGQAVSIEVTATDIPGHTGTRTQNRN